MRHWGPSRSFRYQRMGGLSGVRLLQRLSGSRRFRDSFRVFPVPESGWPLPRALFRLRKGLGVYLVQDLELGNLGFNEVLAVAFAVGLGRLLDPVEVLVIL